MRLISSAMAKANGTALDVIRVSWRLLSELD